MKSLRKNWSRIVNWNSRNSVSPESIALKQTPINAMKSVPSTLAWWLKVNNRRERFISIEITILLRRLFLAVPDVAVEHMGPLYGPMSGDTVYMLLKGRLAKDELVIEVTEDITGLHERPTYTKNCNTVHFSMPTFTQSQLDSVMAQITVYYKGERICQKPYSYHGSIDRTYHWCSLSSRFC